MTVIEDLSGDDMRMLRKLLVLSLAGIGAKRVWELAQPKLEGAQAQSIDARNRLVPAGREAKNTFMAARSQGTSVIGSTKSAAGTIGSTLSTFRAKNEIDLSDEEVATPPTDTRSHHDPVIGDAPAY